MKRIVVIFMLFIGLSSIYAENVKYIRKKSIKSISIHRAPYHGAPVTFSYSSELKTLTLCFHYDMENAEVIITKDGEEIADDVFDMESNEILECDMSECGEGEYVIYVQVEGEVYFKTLTLY